MSDQWDSWLDCTFCSNFKKMAMGDRKAFFAEYSTSADFNPLLDQTDNLILIPDIAPLTEDHLLLISKLHVPSFSALPGEYFSEAELLFKRTLLRMTEFHPEAEIFVFEHGVGYIDGQMVHCGACNRTDHAHIHVLPLPKTNPSGVAEILAGDVAKKFPLRLSTLSSVPSASLRIPAGNYPYLLLWSSLDFNTAYLLIQDSLDYTIPSQIVRQMLAVQSLGLQEEDSDRWDWRNLVDLYPHEMEAMIRSTAQRWCA